MIKSFTKVTDGSIIILLEIINTCKTNRIKKEST